jgi:hypothetical protein
MIRSPGLDYSGLVSICRALHWKRPTSAGIWLSGFSGSAAGSATTWRLHFTQWMPSGGALRNETTDRTAFGATIIVT